MTFFESILKEAFEIEAKEYQTDCSFTYLEDQEGTEYRMNTAEDELRVEVCFREPGREDWLDMEDVPVRELEAVV
jgi:hypothetical protein